MKKLGLSLVVVSMMFAAPAFAEPTVAPQGNQSIALGTENDRLCNDAKIMQENRIRDLRAAVEFDKETERKLLEGARIRDTDANAKDGHAKQWRDAAGRASDDKKRNAFNAFATWLEGEARTDRNFAKERREAAALIGKGWREAANGIAGHEKYLADLKQHCG